MSKSKLTDREIRFMDQMATLMAPWGWSHHVGRMYGFLLLQDEPVSLDDLAASLSISKSSASVAARVLEQFGNARRHSEPGTKRIRYSAPGNHLGPFASRADLLGQLARLLEVEQSADVRPGVKDRLKLLSGFYHEMREAMQAVIDRPRDVGCVGRQRPSEKRGQSED